MTKSSSKESSRVAFYIRKSTEEENRQILSRESQETELRKLAESRGDIIEEENIYRESHSAGTAGKRSLFNDLLERVVSGEIYTIYTWDWDRLVRNMTEGGFLCQLLLERKVVVVTPKQVYDSTTDVIVPAIWSAQATGERLKLIERIKRGIGAKIARGFYNWRAPVGYINSGKIKGHKSIEPDPIKASLVKLLFLEATKGNGLKSLVPYAQTIGLVGQLTKNLEKPLTPHGISSILSNPIYYGYMRYKENLYQGTFEPLISKELWDTVQSTIHRQYVPRPKIRNLPFRGIMTCPECGSAITACVKKGKYIYNHCGKRRGVKCRQPMIQSRYIEEQFREIISNLHISEAMCRDGIEYLRGKHSEKVALQIAITDNLQAEEKRLEERLNRLFEMRLDGDISKDQYDAKKLDIELEVQSVKARRAARDNNSLNWLEQAESLLELAMDLPKIFDAATQEEKEQLIKLVGWNYKLDNKKVLWEYKKPFSYIAEKESGMDWWSWGVSHPRPRNEYS